MNSVNCTANIVPHTLPQAALKVVQCAALIAPYVFRQSAGAVLLAMSVTKATKWTICAPNSL
ncbi:hypothetical protein D3C79_530010 [compost metagenome]